MNTRIVFLEGGKPAQGLKVKSQGETQDSEWTTNEDGQLALDLQEGTQELVVYHDGSWVPHIVNVQQNSSLLLVDLEKEEETLELQSSPKDVNFLDIGRLDLGERYVFEKMLGHGGMGMVIRARDRLLNRSVAIKLLSDELRDNDEAQQIFLAEARHLATLNHPNLVAVHDISKVDERVFMVIEYIKGETIERLVQSLKRLSEPVALKLAIQLTRVVTYLHDHGIIHRDIKPANAMVRNDGTLKLVDFGLARHFDELYIRGTRVRGTPAYMSPEQIRGDHLTPASDIYQLGVTLFEMITGRLPFEKGDISYSHVHEDPPRASEFAPKISPEFDELIALCLRKPTNQRPKSAHHLLQMLQALHRAIDDEHFEIPEHLSTSRSSRDSQMEAKLRTSEIEALSIPKHLTNPGTGQGFDSDIVLEPHADSRSAPVGLALNSDPLPNARTASPAPAEVSFDTLHPQEPSPTIAPGVPEKTNTAKLAIVAALLLALVFGAGVIASNQFGDKATTGDEEKTTSTAITGAASESPQNTATPPADEKPAATTNDAEVADVEEVKSEEEVVAEEATQTTPTASETTPAAARDSEFEPGATEEPTTEPAAVAKKPVARKSPKTVAKAKPKATKSAPQKPAETASADTAKAEKTSKKGKRDGLFDLSKPKTTSQEKKPKTKGLLPMN